MTACYINKDGRLSKSSWESYGGAVYGRILSSLTNSVMGDASTTCYCPYDCDDITVSVDTSSSTEGYKLVRLISHGATWTLSNDDDLWPSKPNLSQQMKDILADRQAPAFISRHRPAPTAANLREARARQTLRLIVGEEQFRNFIRRGFVSITSSTNRQYVIAPGHSMVDVYEQGKQIARLCIQLSGDFPPTDSMIMRCLMVWNQENELWAKANQWAFNQHLRVPQAMNTHKSLVEIAAEMRQQCPGQKMVDPRRKLVAA